MPIINTQYEAGITTRYNGDTYNTGPHLVIRDTETKTPTIRRPIPPDRFAAATERRIMKQHDSFTSATLISLDPYGDDETAPASKWTNVQPNMSTLREPTVSDYAKLDLMVRNKIKDQKINVLQAAAEGRMTVNLLLTTASEIARTFHTLRSGRPILDFIKDISKPNTRNSRRLAGKWLEYQYGWKPLMSDVYGGCEALAQRLTEGVPVYTKSEAEIFYDSGKTQSGLTTTYYESSLRMKVKARYSIKNASEKSLTEIGITNPAALVWELVPWSFCIDWVLPVGDYLQGLDALTGIDDLIVARSYQMTNITNSALTYADHYQYFKKPYGRAIMTETITKRFAPSYYLSLGNLYPKSKISTSSARIATAVALLRQLKR